MDLTDKDSSHSSLYPQNQSRTLIGILIRKADGLVYNLILTIKAKAFIVMPLNDIRIIFEFFKNSDWNSDKKIQNLTVKAKAVDLTDKDLSHSSS